MLPLRVLGLILAFSAAAPAARATEAPDLRALFAKCSIQHRAKFVRRFDQLPKDVQADFVERQGAIVEQGKFFNGGDVIVDDTPRLGFVGAVESKDTWVIWYMGARGYLGASAYRRMFNANEPWLNYLGDASGGERCTVTDAFLSGMDVTEGASEAAAP